MYRNLLDAMDCEYIALQSDGWEEHVKLYLEHVELGQKKGYSPVFFERNMTLSDHYFSRWNIPVSDDAYETLRKMIISKANAHNYDYWYERILNDYMLDVYDKNDEDDLASGMRILELEGDSYYNDLFEKADPDTWLLDDEYVREPLADIDRDSVLALIPTEKPYELLAWIPIGGFNWCPLPEYQMAFAKHLFECYGARLMEISDVSMDYYVPNALTNIQDVINVSRDLITFDDDWYEDMSVAPENIYGKRRWHLWWD